MKKYFMIGILLLATVSLTSCFQHVPPRNVGIKVKTLGDNKGVKPEVLSVGRYWIGMYWDLYTYPTNVTIYPFTAGNDEGSPVDEAMKFQDKDGLTLSCDVAVSAHVNPELVPVAFQTYGGDMENIIKSYVRQDLLSAFIDFSSRFSAEQLYSTKKMEMLVYV
ncbi:MAG: SPFH domain-containing protein, partial [Clostridia bacterium]